MKSPIYLLLMFLVSCTSKSENRLELFEDYYKEVTLKSPDKWKYTEDTIYSWFEERKGAGMAFYQGMPKSPWGEWDEVMNSSSYYDTIWWDSNENAVKGIFYENNDFYKLIGASPNKTERTYFFSESGNISGILYKWIQSENSISDEHMKPIIEWALQNDSLEIVELYPNNEFVPSRENAFRWKVLLKRYLEDQ